MKAIMKTMKRNIVMIVMAVAFALPAVAVEFGNKVSYGEMPQMAFRSTSTMVGIGSAYAANPRISEVGTATYDGAQDNNPSPRGVHKAPPLIVTPGQLEEGHVPIGDAAVPLMLMAMLFAGVIYTRRKKALKG